VPSNLSREAVTRRRRRIARVSALPLAMAVMGATVTLSPTTGSNDQGEQAVGASAFLVSMKSDARMATGNQRLSSTAVNNLNSLLADSTPATPTRLDYTLTDMGSAHDLQHVLLAKSDGSFYLALWRKFGGPRDQVAPATVTFNQPINTAVTLVPELSTTPQNTYTDPTSVQVPVTVIVTIIQVIPAVPEGTVAVAGAIDSNGDPVSTGVNSPNVSASPAQVAGTDAAPAGSAGTPSPTSAPDVPLIPSLTPAPTDGSPLSTPSTGTSSGIPALPITVTAGMPSGGVYRGAGLGGEQRMSAYEAFLGAPTPYALDFQANDKLDNLAWPSWMSDAWKNSGQTVVVGSSLALPGDGNRAFQGRTWSWADAANGALDATWLLEGQRLVASNQANAVLRGNHEFNGGWFPWRVNDGEQANFITAWQRWVTVLRSVAGEHFTFDWNPTIGQEALQNPESAYPGDAYVTRIALDVYDGYYNDGFTAGAPQPNAAQRDAMWDTILSGPRGLVFWRNFATSHAKHMSFPEWGLRNWTESDGKVHGGGDDPAFILRMAGIFTDPSYHVDYQAFWEDPTDGGRGVFDPDSGRGVPVPNSRVAYLKYIAGR
jgi:hypothetical protein